MGRVGILAGLAMASAFAAIACGLASASAVELSSWLVVLGAGIGTTFPLVTVVCQSAAPRAYVGVATACPTLFRSAGGAVGVALVSAILSDRVTAGLVAQSWQTAMQHGPQVVLMCAAMTSGAGAAIGAMLPRQIEEEPARTATSDVTVAGH